MDRQAQFAQQGRCNWAVERQDAGEFIGFVGLSVHRRVVPFTPGAEVGWRLARTHWHQGFATEAARAARRVGLEHPALPDGRALRAHCLYRISRQQWLAAR